MSNVPSSLPHMGNVVPVLMATVGSIVDTHMISPGTYIMAGSVILRHIGSSTRILSYTPLEVTHLLKGADPLAYQVGMHINLPYNQPHRSMYLGEEIIASIIAERDAQ